MKLFEEAIATLGIPGSIAVVLVIIFAVLQLVGEFIGALGKAAPAFLCIRKWIKNNSDQKKKQAETLLNVEKLLKDVNGHYSADNIAKRDEWMAWVNSRAEVYDATVADYKETSERLSKVIEANTAMTQQMFVESSRDRIIDFASKVCNPLAYVSREEFNRIFKIYDKYERFLEEHNMTNGEVEVNYQIIKKAYVDYTANHKFVEEMHKTSDDE